LFCTSKLFAQELFNYAEPASNMAAHSLGLRWASYHFNEPHLGHQSTQFVPELMWGISKNWMLHADAIVSNSERPFRFIGSSLYAKYRFFSRDEVHRHFRMAAFVRAGINNSHVHYQEIKTNGMNTGMELGVIATQLLHKQAISSTVSWAYITDNGSNKIHDSNARQAINLSLSTGRLILPRHYMSYKQTNLNLMFEVLAQYQAQLGVYFCDIAPSLQLIINSQTRVDFGYRQQLAGTMDRMTHAAWMFKIEHLLFNAL
jgi:hypothetical protein